MPFFSKRLEAATKDFQVCKFQFQVVPFRLHTVLHLLEYETKANFRCHCNSDRSIVCIYHF